jgi:hypothetical protein
MAKKAICKAKLTMCFYADCPLLQCWRLHEAKLVKLHCAAAEEHLLACQRSFGANPYFEVGANGGIKTTRTYLYRSVCFNIIDSQ